MIGVSKAKVVLSWAKVAILITINIMFFTQIFFSFSTELNVSALAASLAPSHRQPKSWKLSAISKRRNYFCLLKNHKAKRTASLALSLFFGTLSESCCVFRKSNCGWWRGERIPKEAEVIVSGLDISWHRKTDGRRSFQKWWRVCKLLTRMPHRPLHSRQTRICRQTLHYVIRYLFAICFLLHLLLQTRMLTWFLCPL